jgi:hypothetical protein
VGQRFSRRVSSLHEYLSDEGYTAIALRDLARYVDPEAGPRNPFSGIERRKANAGAK